MIVDDGSSKRGFLDIVSLHLKALTLENLYKIYYFHFDLSIVKFKKAKEIMEGTSLLSPNRNCYNTKTMLR
jgi:hypothetical protein